MATHSSVSCLGNPMDRGTGSYSPRRRRESDTTGQPNNNKVLGGNFSNEDKIHLRIQTRITFYFKK